MSLMVVSYVVIALLLAWLGRKTRIGPVLIFLTSIMLTPLLPLGYIVITTFERRA